MCLIWRCHDIQPNQIGLTYMQSQSNLICFYLELASNHRHLTCRYTELGHGAFLILSKVKQPESRLCRVLHEENSSQRFPLFFVFSCNTSFCYHNTFVFSLCNWFSSVFGYGHHFLMLILKGIMRRYTKNEGN